MWLNSMVQTLAFFPNLPPLSSAATTQAVAQSPHSPAKWMLSIAPGRATIKPPGSVMSNTSATSSLQKGVRDHGDTPWWDDPSASLSLCPPILSATKSNFGEYLQII